MQSEDETAVKHTSTSRLPSRDLAVGCFFASDCTISLSKKINVFHVRNTEAKRPASLRMRALMDQNLALS